MRRKQRELEEEEEEDKERLKESVRMWGER